MGPQARRAGRAQAAPTALAGVLVHGTLIGGTLSGADVGDERTRREDARDVLWAALGHLTGLADDELHSAARELLAIPAPSQRAVWTRSVRCGRSSGDGGAAGASPPPPCAGEAAARVLVALAESGRMPLRGFEPFPGDPLHPLWKAEDRTAFHSWAGGFDDDSDDEVLEDAHPRSLIPAGQPLVVSRVQAAEFVRQAKARILELTGAWEPGSIGRCLEWDEPFYARHGFGKLCSHFDILSYADPAAGRAEARQVYPMGTRVLTVDVLNLPRWTPRDYGIVVCFFVLEHVTDPHAAMRGVARMMLPGGFLLLGAPFVDGVHACPNDFFRYTPSGLRRLAVDAGLEVLWAMSPGGPAVAAGDLLGLKSSYWAAEALLEDSPDQPANVFLLAAKPGRHPRGPMRANATAAAAG